MSRVNARILNKVLTTDVDFTLPPNEDYELFEGWGETDLAPGEIGINAFRSKAYMNTGEEIVTLSSDAIITLNGEDFINAESGEITDIELVNQTDTPIVPDSVVGNKITVNVGGGTPIGAELLKSGQTNDYGVAGSDGDIQAGRLTDRNTLADNNPFGNTTRFTGVTGGRWDGSNWVDVTGTTVANRLAAFPDYIFLDWTTYKNGKVLGYSFEGYYTGAGNKDFPTLCADGIAFSIGTFTTGWRGMNDIEGCNLQDRSQALSLNFYPFNINSSVTFNTITTNPSTTSNCFVLSNTWSAISGSKAGARSWAYTRDFTVTGTVIS